MLTKSGTSSEKDATNPGKLNNEASKKCKAMNKYHRNLFPSEAALEIKNVKRVKV